MEPEEHKAVEQSAIRKMIDQLRKELVEIQYAIHALEALASGKPRRGRPPKFVTERQGKARRGRKPKPATAE
jgi:hypothetical protein